MLELAKQCVDVGLYTNSLDEMLAFYAQDLGLPFEEMLPVGGGVRQHRFGLNGSVLKVNHSRNALADAPTGYTRLLLMGDEPRSLRDPDGLQVEVVARGGDVAAIAVEICGDGPGLDAFWGDALGAERAGPGRYALGTTVLRVRADDGAARSGPLQARGFRYLTIQVRDVRAAHSRLVAAGVTSASPPRRMGDVAMISFVRDPGGNWIELSQRASLTGALPDG